MTEYKHKISACIIALNEEKYLQRCIDSIKKYCFEILVSIDNATTDNTKKIAKQNKCRLFSHDIRNGIDKARNNLLNNAYGDWVLVIDADETINELNINNDYDCYIANINITENNIKHSPIQSFRLWRNHLGIKYSNSNHARPDKDCLKYKVSITGLTIDNERTMTQDEIYNRLKRLYERAKKELNNENNHDRYFDFARASAGIGNYRESNDYIFLSLVMTNNQQTKAILFNMLSNNYLSLGEYELAICYAEISARLSTNQILAYRLLLICYQITKQIERNQIKSILIQNNLNKKSTLPGDAYLTDSELKLIGE